MTPTQLNRLYERNKAEHLAEIIQGGLYFCKGCGMLEDKIEIHHIIKRSQSKYYYADNRNFIELCRFCHVLAEGEIEQQIKLICYDEMELIREFLLDEYRNLSLSEQTLLFKYGK